MFENESCNDSCIKKLNKYLCKIESLFLNRLCFWSSHRKSYGIEKYERVWIYNTLENWSDQLNISKSSIRRVIKSLKDKKIIDSAYLAANKRNRTLYYSINFDGINEFLLLSKASSCVQKTNISNRIIEHMGEHMYIMDNSKQIINKSYKSINKNLIQKNSDQIVHKKNINYKRNINNSLHNEISDTEIKSTEYPKTTIIQDMIKVWKYEFSGSKIELTKNLARFLVAAFKTKFKSCLKKWKKYLKTLKTSVYLMSEKFKLSIWWVIKFITIDRIRAGEFGVDSGKVTLEKEELVERLNQHVERLDETEHCKKLRYSIIEKLSLLTYLSWFTHVKFVEIKDHSSKNYGKIIMKAGSQFVEDWIMRNFADLCGLCLE